MGQVREVWRALSAKAINVGNVSRPDNIPGQIHHKVTAGHGSRYKQENSLLTSAVRK